MNHHYVFSERESWGCTALLGVPGFVGHPPFVVDAGMQIVSEVCDGRRMHQGKDVMVD